MKIYDLFNGDADGLCALTQLRQIDPRPSARLITGVKRDIKLFERVSATVGDHITALDIAMRSNEKGLQAALSAGAYVFYVDHHNPGQIPDSPNLFAIIDTRPGGCTSLLVDTALGGARRAWAVTGAFGDNLDAAAKKRAQGLDLPLADLRQLGRLINYNAYGANLADLHYAPTDLYRALLPFDTPMAFMQERGDIVGTLQTGYDNDMAAARAAKCVDDSPSGTIFALADTASSRRISGIFGNDLATQNPHKAHAVLSDKPGGYLVSVRAPLERPFGAVDLCEQFETGGGRAAAAGINLLKPSDLDRFIEKFRDQFSP